MKLTFLAIIFTLFSVAIAAQDIKPNQELAGRVVARINNITYGSMEPHYEIFIFAAEKTISDQKKETVLVRIVYEFFKDGELLKKDFFDYAKLYDMKVFRQTNCDEKLKDFAYMRVAEVVKDTIVHSDVSILKILDGANKNLFDENKVLPCYVLQANGYKLKKAN